MFNWDDQNKWLGWQFDSAMAEWERQNAPDEEESCAQTDDICEECQCMYADCECPKEATPSSDVGDEPNADV